MNTHATLTPDLFSDMELTTRRMIDAYRATVGMDILSSEVALLNVWRAMWSSALPVARVEAIANALHNATFKPGAIQSSLTKLVKAKFLRSYVVRGVRLYEVNF